MGSQKLSLIVAWQKEPAARQEGDTTNSRRPTSAKRKNTESAASQAVIVSALGFYGAIGEITLAFQQNKP
jgi:hypothetical protein